MMQINTERKCLKVFLIVGYIIVVSFFLLFVAFDVNVITINYLEVNKNLTSIIYFLNN